MKRQGILNQKLSSQIASLGHEDKFVLCDIGFPIPKDSERIDLALTFNIPTMEQCLRALLEEVIIEKVVIAEEMKEVNPDGYYLIKNIFKNQELQEIPQQALVEKASESKFILRSGEQTPYSNLILQAASGVDCYKEKYVICPDDIGL